MSGVKIVCSDESSSNRSGQGLHDNVADDVDEGEDESHVDLGLGSKGNVTKA